MAKAEGRELHREFVGMLFTLAIGQVAVDAATVANSSVQVTECLPSYSHLFLAATVIAASWVGWGQSDHSLSDVNGIFTFDFLELLVDLWLVVLYFFVVKGVELPAPGATSIPVSAGSESKWLFVIFASYFVWDVVTKLPSATGKTRKSPPPVKANAQGWFLRNDEGRLVIIQRGWASLTCAVLGYFAYKWLSGASTDVPHILLADLALLSLVLLFRALKLRDLSAFVKSPGVIALSVALAILFAVCLLGATEANRAGSTIVEGAKWVLGI